MQLAVGRVGIARGVRVAGVELRNRICRPVLRDRAGSVVRPSTFAEDGASDSRRGQSTENGGEEAQRCYTEQDQRRERLGGHRSRVPLWRRSPHKWCLLCQRSRKQPRCPLLGAADGARRVVKVPTHEGRRRRQRDVAGEVVARGPRERRKRLRASRHRAALAQMRRDGKGNDPRALERVCHPSTGRRPARPKKGGTRMRHLHPNSEREPRRMTSVKERCPKIGREAC